jgi:hypothetical protein
MNARNKLYSLALVAAVFGFGSFAKPAASLIERAKAHRTEIVATVATQMPATLPVAGLGF